jgi:RNA polymerase sigma-70 factor (ECF subfamily)
LDGARRGGREELNLLLRRHHDRVYAVCYRMMGEPADAADATQETLIRIVRHLPEFDGRAAFGSWVYRVAVNVCLDELRRRKRRPLLLLDGEAPVTPVTGDGANAAAARLDVGRALGLISEEFRAAVVLRDLAGLSYQDIADVLDVPVGTVRSRIARGRAALVPHLSDPAAEVAG